MRRSSLFLSSLLWGLAWALASPALWAAGKDKVLVATGDDYCPLSCNPASGHDGLGIDLARLVYEPLGWKVQYQYLPFQRGVKYFKNGRVDLVPGVEAGGGADFANAQISKLPVMAPRMCFYTHASNAQWTYTGISSLAHGRLGSIAGYFYWPELSTYIEANKKNGLVDETSAADAMVVSMRKLAKKRIDYFAELRPAVEYQLHRMQLKADIVEATCLHTLPLYMAFRPDFAAGKELNAQWDKTIQAVLRSPQGQAVLQRYGLTLRSISE